jgi:hypothetical protein
MHRLNNDPLCQDQTDFFFTKFLLFFYFFIVRENNIASKLYKYPVYATQPVILQTMLFAIHFPHTVCSWWQPRLSEVKLFCANFDSAGGVIQILG